MSTLGIKRPSLLILPAYIIGIVVTIAAHYLLPFAAGAAVSAVLLLAMLTVLSLVHPSIGGEIVIHIVLYAFVCIVSFVGAQAIFPVGFGPTAIADAGVTWAQIGFIAVQQALYFGIHALFNE